MKFYTYLLVATLLVLPSAAGAATFQTGEQPTTARGEVINDDIYIAGGNVTSNADIAGDLLAAGGNILVNSPVSGDLMVAGGNITVLGSVADDLRIVGGSIVISSTVGGDVIVGAGDVTLSGERVGGDVAIAAGVVHVDTPIAGDARIGAGEVFINAPIAGDVELHADRVTIGENATISGTLTYTSPREAEVADGAQLGVVEYTERAQKSEKGGAAMAALVSTGALIGVLVSLVGALVLGLLVRRFTAETVRMATAQPLAHLGWGVVALIVTPIVGILLLVTVIGAPFGIIALLLYVVYLILSSFLAPILLGSVLSRWVLKYGEYRVDWKTILIGVVAYAILSLIPIIGWIAQFGLFLIALGAGARLDLKILKEWC